MHTVIENSFWQALGTEHASFSIGSELARRYPADILPFAAIAHATTESMEALRELLVPGETVYVEGELPGELAGLIPGSAMEAWQMHFPSRLAEDHWRFAEDTSIATPPAHAIRALDAADAPAMMALAEAAPPGFYRLRSYVLGLYFGIYIDGSWRPWRGSGWRCPVFVRSAACVPIRRMRVGGMPRNLYGIFSVCTSAQGCVAFSM